MSGRMSCYRTRDVCICGHLSKLTRSPIYIYKTMMKCAIVMFFAMHLPI